MHTKTHMDIDAMLREAAAKKTRELELKRLLGGIMQEGELRKIARRKWRGPKRAALYTAAAAAALVLLALSAALSRRVVVEGKAYIAIGDSVNINGDTYFLEESQRKEGTGTLHNIAGTNQYVQIPEASSEMRIMVFPPDSPPQPQRKNQPELPASEVRTMDAHAVYPVIPDLVVRSGPGTGAEELGVLYTGQLVQKLGMHGNWAILEWEGDVAYAYDDYLFEAPEELASYTPVRRYATEPLNVRALPGSREGSEILGELDTNGEVLVTGVIGGWSQIEWEGGKAYVFSRYLHKEGPVG